MMDSNKIKTKQRLDTFLYENGYFESRSKAEICIREGNVLVNNIKEDKPGTMIKIDSVIKILGDKCPFVSRGGYKLDKAIKTFNINLNENICVDFGSSTGGFTDVMLKNGAKKVYAVDCGTNQLEYKLRINDKVVVMENINARYVKLDDFNNDKIDFVSADLSFISLKHVLNVIYNILSDDGISVVLIKPQFEAGKEEVEKGGVVKDERIHKKVINDIIEYSKNIGFMINGLTFSPIKGPSGNIEYLLYLSKNNQNKIFEFDINDIVNKSHEEAK